MRMLILATALLASTTAFAGDAYFGATGGYGMASNRLTVATPSFAGSFYDNAPIFGGFVGYDHKFDNNLVLGIEGDLSFSGSKSSYTVLTYTTETSANMSGSIRGKFGYSFGDVTAYGTLGWTGADVTFDVKTLGKETVTLSGYTLGAGVDYAISKNLFVRSEYRFNDYDSKKVLNLVNTNADQHVLAIGVGYRF